MDSKKSLHSYEDGKLFKFMNRESEDLLLEDPNEEKEISPAMHERMFKGCLSSLFNHLKQEKSFFSQLLAMVSQ